MYNSWRLDYTDPTAKSFVVKTRFTLPAFAKINFSLRVLGRRAEDDLHEIRTVFQTVTLADHLTFESRDDDLIELVCDAPGIPTDESNLVHRAAARLRENFKVKNGGARIELVKRIPAGGGLGGGSSDAAATLLGLAHLWKIQTNKGELVEIGKSIGADVPFFFTGGTALGTGTGTDITPLPDAPAGPLLIVTPAAENVSTAEAYAAMRAPVLTSEKRAAILLSSRAEMEDTTNFVRNLHNDFEKVILPLRPRIGRAKSALLEAGARRALLSGSGASVYGIFTSEEEQAHAYSLLTAVLSWQVFKCAALSRSEYIRALGDCGNILSDQHVLS